MAGNEGLEDLAKQELEQLRKLNKNLEKTSHETGPSGSRGTMLPTRGAGARLQRGLSGSMQQQMAQEGRDAARQQKQQQVDAARQQKQQQLEASRQQRMAERESARQQRDTDRQQRQAEREAKKQELEVRRQQRQAEKQQREEAGALEKGRLLSQRGGTKEETGQTAREEKQRSQEEKSRKDAEDALVSSDAKLRSQQEKLHARNQKAQESREVKQGQNEAKRSAAAYLSRGETQKGIIERARAPREEEEASKELGKLGKEAKGARSGLDRMNSELKAVPYLGRILSAGTYVGGALAVAGVTHAAVSSYTDYYQRTAAIANPNQAATTQVAQERYEIELGSDRQEYNKYKASMYERERKRAKEGPKDIGVGDYAYLFEPFHKQTERDTAAGARLYGWLDHLTGGGVTALGYAGMSQEQINKTIAENVVPQSGEFLPKGHYAGVEEYGDILAEKGSQMGPAEAAKLIDQIRNLTEALGVNSEALNANRDAGGVGFQ